MMTSAPLCEQETSPCSAGTDLFAEAEKELTAFVSAVIQVYGPQYATKAAEHWMQVLDDAHFPNVASKKCFRTVTVSAFASLCQCGAIQVCEEQRQLWRKSAKETGGSGHTDLISAFRQNPGHYGIAVTQRAGKAVRC
jgi:hypothetical protein